MNWEEVGAIGQVLGSIAVFVTLWYLAIQVRHARQSSRHAISQSRGQAIRDLGFQMMDPKVMNYIKQANDAFGEPPHPLIGPIMEKTGLDFVGANTVLTFHVVDWDHRMQTIPYVEDLSPIERAGFDGILLHAYSAGVGEFIYENFLKHVSHPDAIRYLDRLRDRSNLR